MCFGGSMEVKLPALLDNYDSQTDRPPDLPTDLTDWFIGKFIFQRREVNQFN